MQTGAYLQSVARDVAIAATKRLNEMSREAEAAANSVWDQSSVVSQVTFSNQDTTMATVAVLIAIDQHSPDTTLEVLQRTLSLCANDDYVPRDLHAHV